MLTPLAASAEDLASELQDALVCNGGFLASLEVLRQDAQRIFHYHVGATGVATRTVQAHASSLGPR